MPKISGLQIPHSMLWLIVTDSVLITLALVATTALTFLLPGAALDEIWSAGTFARFGLIVAVWGVALYYNEMYDLRSARRSVTLIRLSQASGLACLALAALYYIHPRSEEHTSELQSPYV